MSQQQPPFVIHVSEMADFPDAVYIGRENGRKRLKRSKWHNPHRVEQHGRTMAIAKYAFDMGEADQYGRPSLNDCLWELTGKPLACWCRRSDEPRSDTNMCHGDVLVELWKERYE